MPCSYPFYNMVLLSGVSYMHHTLISYSNYRKAVRAISFQPIMSPSLPIFNDLKLLKIYEIFELRLFNFVFESVNKPSPSCFHDIFLFSSSVRQYATRQANQGDLYSFAKNVFSMT